MSNPFSDLELTKRIALATEHSLNRLYSEHPDTAFFAYSISTYSFIDSLSFSANSFENTEKELEKYRKDTKIRITDNEVKWFPEEWGQFEAFDNDSEEWSVAIELLREHVADAFEVASTAAPKTNYFGFWSDADVQAEELPFFYNMQYVIGSAIEAMKQLDDAGKFRHPEGRGNILLFVSTMGDVSQDRIVSAKVLNSAHTDPDILTQFISFHESQTA